MLAAQQECLYKGTDPKEFQKCIFCTKTFVNQSFLLSHINRRHKEEMIGRNLTKVQLNSFLNVSTSDTHMMAEFENLEYPRKQETQEDLKEVIQDLKIHLNKAKTDELSGLLTLVKQQQDQISQLQNLSNKQVIEINPTVDKHEEGKLKSQELFWQAQVKSLEEKLLAESKKSRAEIENLKEAFEEEKRKQKKIKRKDKRRARREKQLAKQESKKENGIEINNSNDYIKTEMVESSKPQNKLDTSDFVPLTSDTENMLVPKMSNDITDKSMVHVLPPKQTFTVNKNTPYQHSFVDNVDKNSQGCVSKTDSIPDLLNNKQDQEEKAISQPTQVIKPAISAISIQSGEHEYEAPISFHTSKDSMLDMIEKNPTKLEQYRSQTQVLLADQLENLGVNSNSSTLSKQQLNYHLRQLKDHRKSLPNSSEHQILRTQCKEEVEKLASQASMKKGSLKRRMSKGMSSFRKQIYNSLQNVRFKRRENKNIKSRKRSPKKNVAPQPPNITNVQNQESEEVSSPEKGETNVYVPSPKRLPPKPIPRQSKMRQPDPDPVSEISDTEEDEDDDEYQDEGDISSIVQNDKQNSKLQDKNTKEFFIADCKNDVDIVHSIDEHCIDENDKRSDYSDYSEEEDHVEEFKDEFIDPDTEDEQASIWDSEEDNEIDEIADVHQEPEEIKLRRPKPGTKIADLTNIIETQLHRRSIPKPAGGIDPLQAAMDGVDTEEALQDRINLIDEELAKGQSMTDLSTNTLGTSMWGDNGSFHTSRPGSATTLQSGHSSRPGSGQLRDRLKPPQPRPRITSWDSD